jgi:hypothetical protein
MRNRAVHAHLDAALAKASSRKTRQPAVAVGAAGARGKGAAVAIAAAPPPQLAKRASPEPDFEMARVRPVRAGLAPPAAVADDEDAAAPASAPAGAFHVQIGAFLTKGDAERQLTLVRERAGAVIGAHAPYMSRVKRGDRVLFRARYVGFSAQAAAASVCSELKRLEIDCLVMRAE